jgi:hypothetical protein
MSKDLEERLIFEGCVSEQICYFTAKLAAFMSLQANGRKGGHANAVQSRPVAQRYGPVFLCSI